MNNMVFNLAMKGKWSGVVKAYEENPEIGKKKITNSGDTALHIAVAAGRTNAVLLLVGAIKKNASEIPEIKNEKGNTALHLAAALGHEVMCNSMASVASWLINARNKEGETPLFLAALHGKMDAFLALINNQSPYGTKVDATSFRNKNGDTILHSAISGEHYRFAYQIICNYPHLVNNVNQNGQSPLHILASKPHTFYSNLRLRLFHRIIYHCVPVDELKKEAFSLKISTKRDDINIEMEENQLEHSKMTQAETNGRTADEENQHQRSSITQAGTSIEIEEHQQPYSNMNDEVDSESENQKGILKILKVYQWMIEPLLIILSHLGRLFRESLMRKLSGMGRIERIREKKMINTWAVQVMNELVMKGDYYKYHDGGGRPDSSSEDGSSVVDPGNQPHGTSQSKDTNGDKNSLIGTQINKDHDTQFADSEIQKGKFSLSQNSDFKDLLTRVYQAAVKELSQNDPEMKQTEKSAILIAAKNGIKEMVEKILDTYPVAIQDMNSENKNVVLLAVENRQSRIYELLLKNKIIMGQTAFWQVDSEGNSALHLAAKCGGHQSWLIPGGALQMQWEFKWYKFVKTSMAPHFFVQYNKKGKTSMDIFRDTHRELANEGRQWLTKTSEACSVVAALIATVAFGASATVPGGFNENNGRPILGDDVMFNVFAISSLIALCFSVTALIFFLTILTSRYQDKDFAISLPRKLLLGLTSLFASIAAILISFCSGHSFVLKHKFRFATYPIYIATCLPITYFALEQIPLYFDLLTAIFTKVPQRGY